MNGNKCVLDSNFIIFFSKGKIDLDRLRSKYDSFYVSIVSYIEVYAFDFSEQQEKYLIDEFFELVNVIEIELILASLAIRYRKNKIRKIKLPDAVILATAKLLNADLLTDDWDDFLKIDSSVNVLSLDDLRT